MRDAIEWLNDNQGFVMSLLTLIYVIATVIIVWYNRKSIKSMEEAKEAETRPYIVCYFSYQENTKDKYFVVKNFGKSPATINSIVINPEFKIFEQNASEILNNLTLAPLQQYHFLISEQFVKDFINKYSNKFEIHIEYSKSTKKTYNEYFNLNIDYMNNVLSTKCSKSDLNDKDNAICNMEKQIKALVLNNM